VEEWDLLKERLGRKEGSNARCGRVTQKGRVLVNLGRSFLYRGISGGERRKSIFLRRKKTLIIH